jgi:hypothetical protein
MRYFVGRGYDTGFAAQFGLHASQMRAHVALAVV